MNATRLHWWLADIGSGNGLVPSGNKPLSEASWPNSMSPCQQGWGLLSQFPPFRYFPNFSALSKQTSDIEYHVCIWQVSPQLSCGDTCQIWKWFKESNRYFCQIENFDFGEFNERSFSNPHPRSQWVSICTVSCRAAWNMIDSCFVNTLRPRQNGRHFADDTFKRIFLNENVWISIKISLKFVFKGPINYIPALVQIMAWRRPGDKPLSEPMMVTLPTHICVTRPQWLNMVWCYSLWIHLLFTYYVTICSPDVIDHSFRNVSTQNFLSYNFQVVVS